VANGNSKTIISCLDQNEPRLSDQKSGLRSFVYHVEIAVELPKGDVIAWGHNQNIIQSKFEDSLPRYLHITGWTFHLQIKREVKFGPWKLHYREMRIHDDSVYWARYHDLSYLPEGQDSVTIKGLIICSTRTAYRPLPVTMCNA
jgi:hypothetical protein